MIDEIDELKPVFIEISLIRGEQIARSKEQPSKTTGRELRPVDYKI
jgi:hypothetical protein